MSTGQEAIYLGCLPVPDHDELGQLYCALMFETGDPDIYQLGQHIQESNPYIQAVMDEDLMRFLDSYGADEMPGNEVQAYADGLEVGYNFALGALTYLFFLRSPANSMADYLADTPNHYLGVPVATESQRDRCIEVLNGTAEVDKRDSLIDDSSDLSELDTQEFLFESPGLEQIYERACQEFAAPEETNLPRQASRLGFEHGFENAIEMYIQSHEQNFLDTADASYPS
jgi:hypothetical protein